MVTYYEAVPPRIERVEVGSERARELRLYPLDQLAPGCVYAVNTAIEPPQVLGVYTPKEFDARYTPIKKVRE